MRIKITPERCPVPVRIRKSQRLIPLLTASGAGAASRFSIGLVVVAGMSIGTLFTLFVLPAVYVAIATDHRAGAESERTREIEEFDLGSKALKPT